MICLEDVSVLLAERISTGIYVSWVGFKIYVFQNHWFAFFILHDMIFVLLSNQVLFDFGTLARKPADFIGELCNLEIRSVKTEYFFYFVAFFHILSLDNAL